MNTKLIQLAKNMGIDAETVKIALGQKPDLNRKLEDIKTFDECDDMLELTKKDNYKVHVATISKMISFIQDAPSLYEFMKIIWKYSMTKEQRELLRTIFDTYGNDLIKSISTVSGLHSLSSSYGKWLNDVLKEKIRYKILLLEAERIIRLETVEECYERYHSAGEDFQKLLVARANSILLPLLKEIDTVEKAEEFTHKPFLTDEMREKTHELYRQLVRKRINNRDTSWEMLVAAFYTAKNKMPWPTLAHRALVRAARRAVSEKELKNVIEIICRHGIKSARELYDDVRDKYDTIIEAKIIESKTIDACFMLHGHSVTKSERLKLATVNSSLKLATTVEDHLNIENLMGNWQSFEGLNVSETVDYCMNAALYLTSSIDEWKLVWWRCKQKLGGFGQKCIRRLAIIAETEKGIQPEPIVDGLYVINLKEAV